jgi:hypothetical protein
VRVLEASRSQELDASRTCKLEPAASRARLWVDLQAVQQQLESKRPDEEMVARTGEHELDELWNQFAKAGRAQQQTMDASQGVRTELDT